MNRILGITSAALAIALVPTTSFAATASPSPTPSASASATAGPSAAVKQKVRTILYSLSAESGQLTKIPSLKNTYALTLQGTDPKSIWFTDRPYRDSGVLSTGVIARTFAETSDPANVALVLHSPVAGIDTLIAVMTKSAFNAKTGTFTANLRILNKDEFKNLPETLRRHSTRADFQVPTKFSQSSLFIDTDTMGSTPPTASNPANPQEGDTYIQYAGTGPVMAWEFQSGSWIYRGVVI